MNVRVKYKGRRPETLKAYKHKLFRGGPYDFSKGECLIDEKDAAILLEKNPVGFEITAGVEDIIAEKEAAAEAKAAEKDKK